MWLEGEAQEPFSGDQAVADESAGIAGVAAQAMNIWLDRMQRFEWGSMGSSFAFSYAPAFLIACFISSERAGFALALAQGPGAEKLPDALTYWSIPSFASSCGGHVLVYGMFACGAPLAVETLREECGIRPQALAKGCEALYTQEKIGAGPASGSFAAMGMIAGRWQRHGTRRCACAALLKEVEKGDGPE